ncbi:MAG: hypothetical protein L6R28_23745 [Planctomycetes bacterium]|nr:hypothetical protein [Planctomycetota bacterium]
MPAHGHPPFPAVDDRLFLSYADLERPDLADAKALAAKGELAAAAEKVLRAIEATGLRGYVAPQEAAALGKQIAADRTDAVPFLKHYVETAEQLAAPGAKKTDFLSSADTYREEMAVRRDAGHYFHRGRGWYACAQLFNLTGDARWAQAAAKLLAEQPAMEIDPAAYGEFIPVLAWHPDCPKGFDSLSAAHVVQNMGVAVPMLWAGFDDTARKRAFCYAAHHAEILNRGMRTEPAYNIPLHGLVAALGIAAIFPQAKGAARWKATLDRMLNENGAYVALPFATADGYFGEGLGYQKVDQFLLTRCFLIYERAFGGAPAPLRARVEAGYALAAGSLRPDGSSFTIGDHQHHSPHEHEIEHHELLHLGAALFNKPAWKKGSGGLGGTRPPSLLCFLMGSEGYARWKAMPAPDLEKRSHAPLFLKEAGFAHLRAGTGVSKSCHGLLNASLALNHGHHDVTGVTLFALGRELISDPGMMGYSMVDGARFRDPMVHAIPRLGHSAPLGPRHEDYRYVTKKAFTQSGNGTIQVALAEHRLWPGLLARRVLALCLPPEHDHPARAAGAWLVWDYLKHEGSADGKEPPQGNHPCARVSDTAFPLHAPGGEARTAGLDGWSRHRGSDKLVHLETRQALNLTSAEASSAIEVGDNDANVQVSALPVGAAGASVGVRVDEGWLGHFNVPCARPILRFFWRGPIPHECAYVMLPFDGIADEAPFAVTGQCAKVQGELEAKVTPRTAHAMALWNAPIVIKASGLLGDNPKVTFEVQE